MASKLGRRAFLTGASITFAALPALAAGDLQQSLRAIEGRLGGRLGFSALSTGNGHRLNYRAEERFAMCSTFKWLLAATVLSIVDHGKLSLQTRVAVTRDEVLPNSPVTIRFLKDGAMSVDALCEAAITQSDNTAANKLLSLIGGPARVTAFLRSIGDKTTRLDRYELEVNSNLPNDPRDTTTPAAMVRTMEKILVGGVLEDSSWRSLKEWMRNCRTGLKGVRAGLPEQWTVCDKTGSGANGAFNDNVVAWPPHRDPVIIVVYVSESESSVEALQAAHAQLGQIAAAALRI